MPIRARIRFRAKTVVNSLLRDIYSDRAKNNIIKMLSLCAIHVLYVLQQRLVSLRIRDKKMEGVGWLAFIFQQSYNYSVVPSDLSKALVTAVFTKDNKSDPSNYRPVFLSCICCKIMEHIVLSHTAKHLSTNWRSLQISNMASGNDIPVKPYWLAMMTGPNPLTCGDKLMPYYLTSPKHLTLFPTRLLIKLNYYGVGDGMLMWIPAFFSNRSQVVSIYCIVFTPLPSLSSQEFRRVQF